MSQLRILSAALLLALALSGCATPYAEAVRGVGYVDEQVSNNSYLVKYNGGGSDDLIWSYWMYRCAELTRQKGYDLMVVYPISSHIGAIDTSPRFIPAVSDGNDGARMLQTHGGGGSGGSRGGTRLIYVPGGGAMITSFGKAAYVYMYHESDSTSPRPALRVQMVLDMLKPYVDSTGKLPSPDRKQVWRNALLTTPPSASLGTPGA